MTAAIPSTISRANEAYERMRLAGRSAPMPTAKVRTREVGFRLGGFGFTYTSKDLEMGPDRETSQEFYGRAATSTIAANASLVTSSLTRQNVEPETSTLVRRRGTNSYQTQARQADPQTVPTRELLTVI